MAEFNLIDEPWIPCIDLNGSQAEYGIKDALLKAHELREIVDDSPLVTVAIHRLLLAILYRAFEGPTGMREWRKINDEGAFQVEGPVKAYLEKWHDRFFLFHETNPFYQMAGLVTKKVASVARLATEAAGGNNACLFDHSIDDEPPSWNFRLTARQLLASQSFALGFGKSGSATINGEEEELPYSADAIALRGMNVWLQGSNLFETLMANLAPADDSSKPPWELDEPHKHRDRQLGKQRKAVSSLGTVDRLTWQSRLVKLVLTGNDVHGMYFTQGRSADKSTGDPMKVYRLSTEEGVAALALNSGKAAWRDAHSILTLPVPNSSERRPDCLNLIARANLDRQFLAQVVGLASARNKAGKFLLWRHERMPVPVALLNDVNLIERLGGLLQDAERAGSTLYQRAKLIARYFRVPSGKEPSKSEWEDIEKITKDLDPRPAYWARLERHFFGLLENLPNDWNTDEGGWKPDDQQTATNTWREQVKSEAKRALEESIRQLGTTARAIQAVARVRTDFNDYDLKPPAQKQAKAKGKGGKKK